jgi:5-methylcytosine-specific restriction endonuclease McrA
MMRSYFCQRSYVPQQAVVAEYYTSKLAIGSSTKTRLPSPPELNYGRVGGERAGKPFTPSGREVVLEVNRIFNNGRLACVECDKQLRRATPPRLGLAKPPNEAHIDHIVPKAKGGSGEVDNARVLCRVCNQKKSDDFDVLEKRLGETEWQALCKWTARFMRWKNSSPTS